MLRRGSGGGMYTRKAHATREAPKRGQQRPTGSPRGTGWAPWGGGEVRSVRWAAHESGGLKSLRRSDEGRCIQRRGECLVGQRVYSLEDGLPGVLRNRRGWGKILGL